MRQPVTRSVDHAGRWALRNATARVVGAAVIVCVLAAGGARAQGVTVALTPSGVEVAPGSTFTIEITLTGAGSAINGFDAVIGYDPAALTFLPTSPISLQQGTLFTGACGNTFHRFRAGASTDTLTSVLLCNGVSVTGPGQLYRLQFQASSTPQVTNVRFLAGLRFYNAGLYVNPVQSTDAVIGIGMSPAVGVEPTSLPKGIDLRIAPNPARNGATFTIDADRAGRQSLSVFDVRGRLVHLFEDSASVAGTRRLTWNGLDREGRAVAPGTYLVIFQVGGRSVSNRVTLVR